MTFLAERDGNWRLEVTDAPLQDFRDPTEFAWQFVVRGIRMSPELLGSIVRAGHACCDGREAERTIELISAEGTVGITFFATSSELIVGSGKAGVALTISRRALRGLEVLFVVDPSCLATMQEDAEEIGML